MNSVSQELETVLFVQNYCLTLLEVFLAVDEVSLLKLDLASFHEFLGFEDPVNALVNELNFEVNGLFGVEGVFFFYEDLDVLFVYLEYFRGSLLIDYGMIFELFLIFNK